MSRAEDLSRSLLPFDQEKAVVAVIELSSTTWLVAGTLPGITRRPPKKLEPDPAALSRLLDRCAKRQLAKVGRSTRHRRL
jgi:transposase